MFATVRRYTGLSDSTVTGLVDRAADIATVLASVPGAHGSHLIRTREGVILVTVGTDESCLVESGRRFRAWADAHVQEFQTVGEADVWAGVVVLQETVAGPTLTARDWAEPTQVQEGE